MFIVSYKWIIEILGINIKFNEILKALDLQGFEVKSIDDLENDEHLITIEVKANRPDMLSHFGVARELTSFFNIDLPEHNFEFKSEANKKIDFSFNIDKSLCDCYYAVCVDGIDNYVKTPEYMQKRLKLFGLDSINAVVDISNYIVLEYGQPSHIYDRDKLCGNCLSICKNLNNNKFIDLSGKELELNQDDIVIKDSEDVVCVAGLIGSKKDATDKNTKNIIIESATFSKIPIRVTSKRLRLSTLSSYRFERGIDPKNSCSMIKLITNKIIEICGGSITNKFEYKSGNIIDKTVPLNSNKVNKLLGTSLDTQTIINCLEKYKFKCKRLDNYNLSVLVPSFRLDIEIEEDLIEEIARSYGYDNITPVNLCIPSVYRPNKIWEACDVFRNALIGFGFNEVINYAFVPDEICNVLNLEKSNCVILQNALSNLYNLMRPNMVYSLLNSLAYNYSVGNYNLSLFEIGRVYKKNEKSETLSSEEDHVGFIISGDNICSGFGITKPVKFDFYDLSSYLHNIFSRFNQNIEFRSKKLSWMKNSYDILSNGEKIGILGEILKEKFIKLLPNIKLIKDNIFYCEIDLKNVNFHKKVLKCDSKYPSIVRQYNLVCKKSVCSKDMIDCISSFDKSVNNVAIRDIYEDEKMIPGTHSLLFEVRYRLLDRTLSSDEVELIESRMLEELFSKFSAKIK